MIEKIFQSTLARFITVGAVVEALYIGIYSGLVMARMTVVEAVFIAGGICISLNGYLQVRWSFRLKFTSNLMIKFYAVQGICLVVNILIGEWLSIAGTNKHVIGIVTLVTWGGLSYLLSRAIYKVR